MKTTQMEITLPFLIRNRRSTMLKSRPGVGKTDICKQSVARCIWEVDNLPFDLMICHPSIEDPTDYKGLPWHAFVDGVDVARFLPFGNLERMIRATRPLVVMFDDIGQASPAVQSALMQILWEREINGIRVSDFVSFIACTNRREDKSNVVGVLEAVKSRFITILDLEYSTDGWVRWALNHNMPTPLIQFIQFKPDIIEQAVISKDIENTASPRTVANVGDLYNDMLKEPMPKDIRYELFKGAAGQVFAIEFTAFIDLYMNLPKIANVIADPFNTPIPDTLGAQYALTGGLADAMTTITIGPIYSYLKRLSREIGWACMKNAAIKKPELCNSREYIEWAVSDVNH